MPCRPTFVTKNLYGNFAHQRFLPNFVAMNTQENQKIKWSECTIIADADYVDKVAFNLVVNFERMLGRRIPPADFSQWVVDVALDGRLKPGDHETQVVLLHGKHEVKLANFAPAHYQHELNGQAFRHEALGEFVINTIPTDQSIARKDEVILDLLHLLLTNPTAHRILIVGNFEEGTLYNDIRQALREVDDEEKHITLFTMQPGMPNGNFRQELLGYSLMNAMGITQTEIDNKMK